MWDIAKKFADPVVTYRAVRKARSLMAKHRTYTPEAPDKGVTAGSNPAVPTTWLCMECKETDTKQSLPHSDLFYYCYWVIMLQYMALIT